MPKQSIHYDVNTFIHSKRAQSNKLRNPNRSLSPTARTRTHVGSPHYSTVARKEGTTKDAVWSARVKTKRKKSPPLFEPKTITAAMEEPQSPNGKPFKVTDASRTTRKGVVAASLEDLTSKVIDKLGVTGDVTVVLEVDGTEIDDEEYFATLDPHTNLMILNNGEKWQPPGPPCRLQTDQVDDTKGGTELAGLVGKLKHNLCHVSLLGGAELELLSDMDPESLVDITFPDKIFLEQLKEASGRYLSEKRQAQDAMDLLRLYQEKEVESGEAN